MCNDRVKQVNYYLDNVEYLNFLFNFSKNKFQQAWESLTPIWNSAPGVRKDFPFKIFFENSVLEMIEKGQVDRFKAQAPV